MEQIFFDSEKNRRWKNKSEKHEKDYFSISTNNEIIIIILSASKNLFLSHALKLAFIVSSAFNGRPIE